MIPSPLEWTEAAIRIASSPGLSSALEAATSMIAVMRCWRDRIWSSKVYATLTASQKTSASLLTPRWWNERKMSLSGALDDQEIPNFLPLRGPSGASCLAWLGDSPL